MIPILIGSCYTHNPFHYIHNPFHYRHNPSPKVASQPLKQSPPPAEKLGTYPILGVPNLTIALTKDTSTYRCYVPKSHDGYGGPGNDRQYSSCISPCSYAFCLGVISKKP